MGADIRHTMGGEPTNSFYVDDRGGSVNNGGNDNSYFLNLLDIDQSTFGTLLLYSNNGSQTAVDDGLVDEDFVNSSGINRYDLSTLPGTLSPGEIGLSSAAPLTPVFFEGGQSGLVVEQVSYTTANPGENFVILEFRVLNPTNGDVDAMLALANDFDVDLKSNDATAGYDNSIVPTVYQQESLPLDPTHTTVGVSILHGTEARYRLEVCGGPFGSCNIFADDNDLIRKAFFQGVAGQTGDLTQGAENQDFAVTIAADLGTIPAGEASDVVFCYTPANGGDLNTALTNLLLGVGDCGDFYDTEIKICGNGLVNFDEDCDDSDTNIHDSCPSGPNGNCQNAVCGDGFLWNEEGGTEQCDNGAANSNTAPNACRTSCRNAGCGDRVTDSGEQCDDGNPSNTDSCLNTCLSAKCGDGFVRQGAEVCDDGNNINGDGCSADCRSFESCGNGQLDPGETCDDGNTNTSDGCPDGNQGTCRPAFCGDGYLNNTGGGTEQCDDGNNLNNDGCSAGCEAEGGGFQSPPADPVCGNGSVETGEECDDGNTQDHDGCTSRCAFELVLQGGGASANTEPNRSSGGCSLREHAAPPVESGWLSLALLGCLIWLRKRQHYS